MDEILAGVAVAPERERATFERGADGMGNDALRASAGHRVAVRVGNPQDGAGQLVPRGGRADHFLGGEFGLTVASDRAAGVGFETGAAGGVAVDGAAGGEEHEVRTFRAGQRSEDGQEFLQIRKVLFLFGAGGLLRGCGQGAPGEMQQGIGIRQVSGIGQLRQVPVAVGGIPRTKHDLVGRGLEVIRDQGGQPSATTGDEKTLRPGGGHQAERVDMVWCGAVRSLT
jgi:hypothetical protein